MKSTEIALAMFGENPTQGNPNKPYLSYSEFGNRNRIVASSTYRHEWSESWATSVGVFIEVAEGIDSAALEVTDIHIFIRVMLMAMAANKRFNIYPAKSK